MKHIRREKCIIYVLEADLYRGCIQHVKGYKHPRKVSCMLFIYVYLYIKSVIGSIQEEFHIENPHVL